MYQVVKPRISEKAYQLSQDRNVYIFEVPSDANKLTVAQMLEKQYDVKVEAVNISVLKGKKVRSIRKGGKVSNGKRRDVKKAYVTLQAGQSIPVFATEDKDADKAPKAPASGSKTRTKKESK